MKKILSILAFVTLSFFAGHAYGQSSGNGGGNAWGNGNHNGIHTNNGNHGSLPMSLVVRIIHRAAPLFPVPQGILLQAYFQGTCTIVFDPIFNGYLVTYGGNVVVIGIADL